MSENEPNKARVLLAQSRPWLPAAAVVLVLIALWLAWAGWRQTVDDGRRSALSSNRDTAVQLTARTLKGELERLDERMASAPVQAALAAGDLDAAGAALGRDWPHVEHVEVLPTDLVEPYAGLADGGYGRVAVAEAALSEGKPVLWIVRDGDGARVALAAPARAGDAVVGVAYVRLPLARATAGLESVEVPASTYLALRQGGFNLVERGDAAYAEAAERMAVPVPGTGLRIAAGVPARATTPFGLSAIPAFVVATLLLLLAYLTWRLPARISDPRVVDHDDAPTLEQALVAEPGAVDAGVPDGAARIAVRDAPKAAPVMIDPGIFRAYDIRGIVGQSLDIGVAELIGHSIGSLMHDKGLKDIVIGRDGRLSGPDMVAGLTAGLRKAGREVIDIGMAPTPVVYFGAYHLRTGCCVSITGSHNPPDYNGFKIVIGGETLYGDAITDLHARIADDRLHTAAQPGGVTERDISDDYVERIASDVQVDRPIKVVVDAGNGVAGEIGPRVLEAIGATVEPLYCEIDGTFPNHHPDPSEPHNLVDLIDMVKRFDADLGIAFDGDGDRLGVVTREGDNIFADRLLMLFAADVLERNPGAVIVYDVKCTGRLQSHILRHGGSPLMWKTGHSLIKAKMRETEAELAGEMSGHFFFGERWYGFDDGIYAAARLLEILAARPETPSEVLNALPTGIATAEIKVDAPHGNPHAFVERFVAEARFEGGARPSTIDGLRVDWADGWGLVRASNTTPVLVLRFDADSEEALHRIREDFRAQLLAIDPDLPLPF
ncbi:phosphomannomutase/phosphoglucomutase [Luteimonas sp. MC1572]|uniref:phosphomannomutase/phosphoglucomutase n=1 Tax=Luteimonas sp. MC1572 TaxID=2799325 RepID=UPI0018F09B9A|nr:phosphomannomutase/phosphoglucomutase [Luteimonas sp. MC1572]MBJ6982105.1 phosphomannomutase/phosphoglucomutase [Luteimonas sp. MC1572]QQO03399.1 phosphomannomutase/phosphoglucomutase [Luteimonas sp. MC1572]